MFRYRNRMNYVQRWKRTAIANKAMVVATVLVAFGTLCLAVAAFLQYMTAREQSRASAEQAAVAREQAKLMQGQLNAMVEQASSMKDQTQSFKNSVVEATKTTAAAIESAKAGQRSAAAAEAAVAQGRDLFRQDQRPYMWLTDHHDEPRCVQEGNGTSGECLLVWDWHFTNFGRSPALDVRIAGRLAVGPTASAAKRNFDFFPIDGAPTPTNKDGFSTAFWPIRITLEKFDQLMNADNSIVLYGRISYSDAYGSRYESRFCRVHLKEGPVAYCPDGSNY